MWIEGVVNVGFNSGSKGLIGVDSVGSAWVFDHRFRSFLWHTAGVCLTQILVLLQPPFVSV